MKSKTLRKDDPLRGTGRTTALMLQAIAGALLRPNEFVPFKDHCPKGCLATTRAHCDTICHLIDLLGLSMTIRIEGGAVYVESPIAELRGERPWTYRPCVPRPNK